MESTQHVVQNIVQKSKLSTSNVFSKSVHSRLYQSFHLQNSTLTQGKAYDSEYRYGFPKLYSFDTSVQNKSKISLDQRNKYSFRNENSRVIEENTSFIQQINFLRSEVNRLTALLESQRRLAISRSQYDRVLMILSSKQSQISRLTTILTTKETQIRTLRQRIIVLQRQSAPKPQTNEWQLRYRESQTIINQLNQQLLNQNGQVTRLNSLIGQYTSKINQLEKSQQTSSKPDPQLGLLQGKVDQYQFLISELREQLSEYELQITRYESQITTLQQTNWRYERQISQLEKVQEKPVVVDNEKWIVQQGRLNLRIIILLEEINRLRQKQRQLGIKSEQLHAYLLKAENYIEEIQQQLEKNNLKQNVPAHIVQKVTRLEQENSKYTLLIQDLQSRLSTVDLKGIPQEVHFSNIGERDLRIIILLQEINRLNQKVLQIRDYLVKAEDYIQQLQNALQNQETVISPEIENQIQYLSDENHRLNVIIENYITEIKNLKVTITQLETKTTINNTQVKVQYRTSPQIEAKIAFLAQENERLSRLVLQWQNKPARVETKVQTKVQYRADPLLQSQYAKLQLRSIILLEQINRLNYSLRQVQSYLINAENYIQQLELRFSQNQATTKQVIREQIFRIPPEIQSKLTLLVSENQRLLRTVTEINSRPAKIETKVEYRIPEEVEKELAKFTLKTIFLLQEINRLNYLAKEIQQHLITAQSYIEQCEIRISEFSQRTIITQFQVPPEIQQRLQHLVNENYKLSRQLVEFQNRPARVETQIQQKIQFRISPEIEARIALLASENERLKVQLTKLKQVPTQDSTLTLQYGKLQLRSLFLLEQINRLNQSSEQLRQNLITAENYIYDLENRPAQSSATSPQIEARLAFLAQQNQRLIGQINKITLSYEQQINVFKTQITNYTTQINHFKTQINTYNIKISQLEKRPAATTNVIPHEVQLRINSLELQWGRQHLRIIILLEQINRLNAKFDVVDAQRVQVISHLVNAQNYIQQLQAKYTQLQMSSKHSSITSTTVSGSNSAIQQLNSQLFEVQNRGKIEVSGRDLRIIFLLQQINRLNHKQKSLLSQFGGSSRQIESSQQIMDLRREKEQCERELQDVLVHLRQAEEYIGELVRQNEGFSQQRDALISQLNSLQHRRL